MAWFNNFSIRTKLLWGFVIVALLLAGVGLMGVVNANKLGNVAIEVYESNVRPFVVLANLRANTFNTSLMMRDMILLDDKETFQKLQLGIEEIKVKNDKMIQDYKSTAGTLAGENEKMNEFKSKLADFRAVRSQVIALIGQGKREEALKLLNTTARERNAATIAVINAIIEMNVRSAEQSATANKALMSAVQTTLVALVLVGVLFAILIGLVIARGISNPIKRLDEAAQQIAVGNFGVEISSQCQDEVGSLTRSFGEVVGTLNKFAKAQNEMQRQHDAGTISYRIPSNEFKGQYAELADGTNALVKSHIDVKMRVVEVITQYAAGNFAQDMDRLPGEKAKITKSIDDVKASLQSVNKELAMLIDAAQRGNLSVRGDVSKFQYTFREMVGGMNQMLDAIVMPFNEASDVLKQMAEGNLSVKMTGHYQGDYAALKNSLNTTVDLMPFQECIAVLQELSAGNFNVTMQGTYKGDSLALKNALNQTIDSVSQTLAQVIAVVEQVSLGAQQVATASNDLAQGAQHQAAALEEISSSMTEIGAQTKLNAKGSEQANMLVQESQRTAELGTSEMERLTQAMNAISDGSRSISKIIKVIDEIAFQTNLLALNAAVEAARAGRHGLGFAVVAEEVRNLAARSAEAAKETADLIEGSIEKVQNGNVLVGKTGEVLHRIAENSTVVAQNVAEIASASKEQSTAIDQISIGLNQIDSVTQQNTANTESSATAAEELSAQARELRALIARFQLSSAHAHIASGYAASAAPSPLTKQHFAMPTKRFGSQVNGGAGGSEYTSDTLARHSAALDSLEFARY